MLWSGVRGMRGDHGVSESESLLSSSQVVYSEYSLQLSELFVYALDLFFLPFKLSLLFGRHRTRFGHDVAEAGRRRRFFFGESGQVPVGELAVQFPLCWIVGIG